MKVVIVDDHPIVRAGLVAVLHAEPGFEVVGQFGAPEDAFPFIASHPVDVVLMDLRFGRFGEETPGMNGIDAVRELRHSQGPPVLVVTTYGSDPEILEALAAGAAGYVLKDAGPGELLAAVRRTQSGQRFLGTGVASRVQRSEGKPTALTRRELQVLRMVATGATNSAVAQRLSLSGATVKTHLAHIFDKLQVRSRTAAVAAARAEGVLEE